MLVKAALPGSTREFVYELRMQEDGNPGRLLGRTTPQLTFDLLSFLHNKKKGYKYPLPKRIYNLRIADITTCVGTQSDNGGRLSPWKESGLWVGVTIHGIGSFQTRKA